MCMYSLHMLPVAIASMQCVMHTGQAVNTFLCPSELDLAKTNKGSSRSEMLASSKVVLLRAAIVYFSEIHFVMPAESSCNFRPTPS